MQQRCSTRLQLHAGPTFIQVHSSFARVSFGWVTARLERETEPAGQASPNQCLLLSPPIPSPPPGRPLPPLAPPPTPAFSTQPVAAPPAGGYGGTIRRWKGSGPGWKWCSRWRISSTASFRRDLLTGRMRRLAGRRRAR
jgi:hypothetical protein